MLQLQHKRCLLFKQHSKRYSLYSLQRFCLNFEHTVYWWSVRVLTGTRTVGRPTRERQSASFSREKCNRFQQTHLLGGCFSVSIQCYTPQIPHYRAPKTIILDNTWTYGYLIQQKYMGFSLSADTSRRWLSHIAKTLTSELQNCTTELSNLTLQNSELQKSRTTELRINTVLW